MPSDPFRLRVMKALTDTIKNVNPANGCMFDLSDYVDEAGRNSERVFRGRDIFGTSDPLPMVTVLEDFRDPPKDAEAENSSESKGKFKVLIQGFVENDPDHPLDDAYRAAAEVIQALVRAKKERRNILGLGYKMPCVSAMSIGAPIARPADDEVSITAYFFVAVTLTLVEDLERPFA